MAEYQLLKFHASWCGPCKTLAPIVDEFVAQHANQVELVPVDVDQHPDMAQAHNVMSVPTVILSRDNKAVEHHVGSSTREAFFKKFEAALQVS